MAPRSNCISRACPRHSGSYLMRRERWRAHSFEWPAPVLGENLLESDDAARRRFPCPGALRRRMVERVAPPFEKRGRSMSLASSHLQRSARRIVALAALAGSVLIAGSVLPTPVLAQGSAKTEKSEIITASMNARIETDRPPRVIVASQIRGSFP